MRTYHDCIPCFARQALDAARRVTADPAVHEHVLRATLRQAADMPFDRPPPWMGRQIHRLLRELTGDPDPYRQDKRRSNELALSLLPSLKQQVADSADPFGTAVRLAIAGNIIDLGTRSHIPDDEVRASINTAVRGPLDEITLRDLRRAARAAETILYLADNAGEIVFDRLLIEELPLPRVTLAVRGHPVINDATAEDAAAAGLANLVTVVDNGSDAPGTLLETCSPDFRERFQRADLVIAKGQGNYETLSDAGREVFFLLRVKCPVIARDLGCDVGRPAIRRCGAPGDQKTTNPPPGRFDGRLPTVSTSGGDGQGDRQ